MKPERLLIPRSGLIDGVNTFYQPPKSAQYKTSFKTAVSKFSSFTLGSFAALYYSSSINFDPSTITKAAQKGAHNILGKITIFFSLIFELLLQYFHVLRLGK